MEHSFEVCVRWMSPDLHQCPQMEMKWKCPASDIVHTDRHTVDLKELLVEVEAQTCEVLGQAFPWWVLVYCCFSFYQTLTSLSYTAGTCSTCSLIATVLIPHLLGHTKKSAGVSSNNFPLCFFTVLFSHTLLSPHRLSPLLYFFVFKVFIHLDFILHSFLFLIFLSWPLYSCLQHPAMLTQPVLRGSELLKPLLPFPLCRSGPQRKDGEKGGKDEGMRMNEMMRIDLLEQMQHCVEGVKKHKMLFCATIIQRVEVCLQRFREDWENIHMWSRMSHWADIIYTWITVNDIPVPDDVFRWVFLRLHARGQSSSINITEQAQTHTLVQNETRKTPENVSWWSQLANLWDIKYFPEHTGKQNKTKTTNKTGNPCTGQITYRDSNFWTVTLPQHIQPSIHYLALLFLLHRVVLPVTDLQADYILDLASCHIIAEHHKTYYAQVYPLCAVTPYS